MSWNTRSLLVTLVAVLVTVLLCVPAFCASGYQWQVSAVGGFGEGWNNQSAGPMVEYTGELYLAMSNNEGAQVRVKRGTQWEMINESGFGDANNSEIPAMEVHGDYLYAGTQNWLGCQVWRYDGSSWERVDPSAGFGNMRNITASSMEVHQGTLYVGVRNYNLLLDSSQGGQIWSYDEANWTKEMDGGFGDNMNIGVSALKSYNGQLYAGTARLDLTIDVFNEFISVTSKGCQLWRGIPGAWEKLADNGFGHEMNGEIGAMDVFEGKLFMGTSNGNTSFNFDFVTWKDTNYKYKTDGIYIYSFDGTDITEEISQGFGNYDDSATWEMASVDLNGEELLLVGTSRAEVKPASLMVYDGDEWFHGADDGFGNNKNWAITSLAEFEGVIYAGTCNQSGLEVWCGTLGEPTPKPEPPQPDPGNEENTCPVWYLAEGSTDWGFDCYISIINPNDREVTAKITYMTDQGARQRDDTTIPANSQLTVNPASDLGDADFSTRVECLEGKSISADRTMIWTGEGASFPGSHCSIGVTEPVRAWYLPEGSSDWGFETWLLIQNPNDIDASCRVSFMTEGSEVGPRVFDLIVPANCRRTYSMTELIGQRDASIKVESDVPVISERSMYRNDRREGHCSIGASKMSNDYFLAEGSTSWGFTTFLLVQNPNDQPSEVTVNYMTTEGPVLQEPFVLPANSRKTIRVNDVLPGRDFSTLVHGSVPIAAERAMYWNGDTSPGEGSHNSIGLAEPHTYFFLPDGQSSDGWETWTLVQNPNDVDVAIALGYLSSEGGLTSISDIVPANSRKTYSMADAIDIGRAGIVVNSRTPGKKIVVERAMYLNSRSAGAATIGGYLD